MQTKQLAFDFGKQFSNPEHIKATASNLRNGFVFLVTWKERKEILDNDSEGRRRIKVFFVVHRGVMTHDYGDLVQAIIIKRSDKKTDDLGWHRHISKNAVIHCRKIHHGGQTVGRIIGPELFLPCYLHNNRP